MLPSFTIIAGSYDKLLYGLNVSSDAAISPIFIFPAHLSAIKSLATSGKWLATGSADEIVKLWDLRRNKELGALLHHRGSITFLAFPSPSLLLSASEDGDIALFHPPDWSLLRTLKGHTGRINSVAVHPSSKLALSVGKDRTLRMWDLIRGKGAASTKLGKEGEIVRWSPSGSKFAVQSLSTIDLFSTKMSLLHTITHPSRIHDIKFYNEYLLVAAEDKKVAIYSFPDDAPPTIIAELVGHSNRVKAVDTIAAIACTISSDGFIRLYNLDALRPTDHPPLQLDVVAQYDTKGSRLTCLALADARPPKRKEAPDPTPVSAKRRKVPVDR